MTGTPEAANQPDVAARALTRTERDAVRRQQKRDKDRLRKERQRGRQQAAAAAAAMAEAARLEEDARRQERLAEQLAPAVLREPVMTGAQSARGRFVHAGVAEEGAPLVFVETQREVPGHMLLGARVRIVDGRPVRAFGLTAEDDPVVKLARDSRAITQRHAEAARQLQLDWNDVGGGLGLGAVDYLRTGGGGGGGGLNEAMLAQAETRARLDGAIAHLGAYAPCVARIVLDCVPVYVWAGETGKTTLTAIAWLAAALGRLVTFYWPPDPTTDRALRILTFGPSRAAYDMGVDAPAAADA